MNQSEHLYREIQTTERQLRERDEEIARLREELSRAAVRDGEVRQAIPRLKGSQDFLRFAPHIQHGIEMAEEAVNAALATPSPLSDAVQEVLEAAVELTQAVRELLNPTDQAPAEDRVHGHRSAHDRLRNAVDRYLALLEGRDRKEE